MNKMKYIVFDNYDPIVFPDYWDHKETANRFPNKKPTSAGFVYIDSRGIHAIGRSHSLNLDSKSKEDSKILNRLLGKV